MSDADKDRQRHDPGREPLRNIDPVTRRSDDIAGGPEKREEREKRSTRVNDDDVGAERREREPDDPQRNPRTGPIG